MQAGRYGETEPLPTEVGRIGDVIFEVLQHDVLDNDSVGGRGIPPSPEPTSPIAPAQRGEFPLHLAGRSALHLTHQIGNRDLRWHRYEHVDIVG